jgi:hypothetical protein
MALTLSVKSFQVPAAPLTARHAGHLGGEGRQLVHHGVDDLADAEELAAQRAAVDLHHHLLREVALSYRADDARHFGRRLHHILDQVVDRADGGFPAAGRVPHMAALADAPVLADHARKPLELVGELLVHLDDFVEGLGDVRIDAVELHGKPDGEVAAAEGAQGDEYVAAVELVPRHFDVHGGRLRRSERRDARPTGKSGSELGNKDSLAPLGLPTASYNNP